MSDNDDLPDMFDERDPPRDPVRYGNYRWGVVSGGMIHYYFADSVAVVEGGTLVLTGPRTVNAMFAAGHWIKVFAASVVDGSEIACD